MPKKTAKKKPGPPPKPAGERAKMASTKLDPDLWAWVAEQGGGSVTRGLRLVATAARAQTTEKNLGNS